MNFCKLMTFKLVNWNIEKLENFESFLHNGRQLYNDLYCDKHCLDFTEAGYYWLLCNRFYCDKNFNNYLMKLISNKCTIEEYYNYIQTCDKLKIDLNFKDNLFIDDFENIYFALSQELRLRESGKDEIKTLGDILNIINHYEFEDYIIFPCPDGHALIDESVQMHNCVRMYYDYIKDGFCQIYFMRKKDAPNESLVTIEVKNNKIVQALAKYNTECNEEQKRILKMFERKLIKFEVEDSNEVYY